MSASEKRFLKNSYKYCTLSIDSFHNRLLKGRVFHESLGGGLAFGTLFEMVYLLEGLFDRQHYPMKSVEQRNFEKMSLEFWPPQPAGEDKSPKKAEGEAGIFRLYVRYRYYATWQGEIMNVRDGKTQQFSSFLELMDYFSRELGSNREEVGMEKRRSFANEFDIKEAMECRMKLSPEMEAYGNVAAPGAFIIRLRGAGPVTFVIKVLFRRNSTWQGIVFWKEKQCQVNFRSFMELLFLMQNAIVRSGAARDTGGFTGHEPLLEERAE